MLALSGGCASSQSKPMQTASYRNDSTVVAMQQSPTVGNDGYRTMQPSVANTQVRTDAYVQTSDGRVARVADASTAPGIESSASRAGRVTVTSANEPPETKVETPSHTPNDNEFWVGGHWVADSSGRFDWQPGRVEQLRPGQLFVGGGWAATPQGWEFTPEYWR